MSTITTPLSSQVGEPTDSTAPSRSAPKTYPFAQKTLKITEIFYSLQGESTWTGIPCVFVRLMGCNLRCTWCDTTYAFTEGRSMALDEILARVKSFHCRTVEITGGEPLLQPEVYTLIERLLEGNFRVLLETSGERLLDRLPKEIIKIVDVKCPSSGEADSFNVENLKHLGPADELKFVIADENDYRYAREWIRTQPIPPAVTVLFSPAWNSEPQALASSEAGHSLAHAAAWARQLAEWVLRDHLPVRLQMQFQKILWGAEARGV